MVKLPRSLDVSLPMVFVEADGGLVDGPVGGVGVVEAEELEGAFKEAIAHAGPATVEILADALLV